MKKSFQRFYPAMVFLLALLLYANTIPNDYNFSDSLVTINHRTTSKGFEAIPEIFSGFYYEDDMGYQYGYRPITHLSFALEHQVFGESPHISHAVNVLLYAFLCLSIFYLAKVLDPDKKNLFALIVALIFTIHPLHTEVVASIKNRDEILSLWFGVLAMISVFKLKKENSFVLQSTVWLLALGLFLLGFYSKNSNIFLLAILPVGSIIFSEGKRVLLPILFFIGGLLLIYKQFTFSLGLIIGTAFVGSVLIVLTTLFHTSNRHKLGNFIKSLLERIKSGGQVILSLGRRMIYQLSKALTAIINWIQNSFVLIKLWIGQLILYLKNNTFLISLIVYLGLLAFSMFTGNNSLQIYAYVVFLVYNFERFKSHALGYTWILIPAITASYYLMGFYSLGWGFYFVLLLLSLQYFRFFWIIALLGVLDWTNLPNSSVEMYLTLLGRIAFWFMLMVPIGMMDLKDNRVFAFFRRYKNWISLVFILLLLGQAAFQYSARIEKKSNYDKSVTKTEDLKPENLDVENPTEENLFTEEILPDISNDVFDEFDKNPTFSGDRPILFVENPIIDNWEFEKRLILALNTNFWYFKKLLIPFPRSYYYGYNQIQMHEKGDWQTLLSGLFLFFIIMMAAFLCYKKWFLAFFALIFTQLALLPYLNFAIPIAGIVADRLAFTSSLGFSFGLAILFFLVWDKIQNKKPLIIISTIIGLLCISAVLKRNVEWKDSLTLFQNDISHLENSAVAHSMYGESLLNKAQQIEDLESGERDILLSQSIDYLEKATEIYDGFHNDFYHLGIAYYMKGNLWDAQRAFVKSYEIDSSYLAFPYLNMAEWAVKERQDSLAIYNFSQYLILEPYDEMAYFQLVKVLLNNKQNYAGALILEKMIEYFPQNVLAYYNLQEIYRGLGNETRANYFLNKGLKIDSFQMNSLLFK